MKASKIFILCLLMMAFSVGYASAKPHRHKKYHAHHKVHQQHHRHHKGHKK